MKKISKAFVLVTSIILILSMMIGSTLAIVFVQTGVIDNIFNPQLPYSGSITVKASVQHNLGPNYQVPTNLVFDFAVGLGTKYSGKTVQTSKGPLTVSDDGYLAVSVKPGDSITVKNIESGLEVSATIVSKPGFSVLGGFTQTGTVKRGDTITFDFVNIYDPQPVTPPAPPVVIDPDLPSHGDEVNITLSGIKVLEGRDWKAGDTFSFILEYKKSNNEYVEVATQTVTYDETNDEYYKFDFTDTIRKYTFIETGLYEFRVRELEGSVSEVEYDKTEKTFKVRISDYDMDGFLEIVDVIAGERVTVEHDADTKTFNVAIEFNNKFNGEIETTPPEETTTIPTPEDVTLTIPVINTIEDIGNVETDKDGFLFVIENLETGERQTVVTDKKGLAEFLLEYTAKDADKSFKYEIYAVNNNEDGITYSDKSYVLDVDVIYNAGANALDLALRLDGVEVEAEDIKIEFTTTSDQNVEHGSIVPLIVTLAVATLAEVALFIYQIYRKKKKAEKEIKDIKLNSIAGPVLFFGILVPGWQVVLFTIFASTVVAMLIANIAFSVYLYLKKKQAEKEAEDDAEAEASEDDEDDKK